MVENAMVDCLAFAERTTYSGDWSLNLVTIPDANAFGIDFEM